MLFCSMGFPKNLAGMPLPSFPFGISPDFKSIIQFSKQDEERMDRSWGNRDNAARNPCYIPDGMRQRKLKLAVDGDLSTSQCKNPTHRNEPGFRVSRTPTRLRGFRFDAEAGWRAVSDWFSIGFSRECRAPVVLDPHTSWKAPWLSASDFPTWWRFRERVSGTCRRRRFSRH